MPMIDVYATVGTFKDPKSLARDLAETLMKIEQVPNIPMFRKNTAAFIHDLPDGALSNVDGDGNYVRVQVLTNAGALNRDKQLAVVRQFTDLVAAAAGDPSFTARTWVLLTEAIEGGWGLAGHANTNAELVDAARAQIAELQKGSRVSTSPMATRTTGSASRAFSSTSPRLAGTRLRRLQLALRGRWSSTRRASIGRRASQANSPRRPWCPRC